MRSAAPPLPVSITAHPVQEKPHFLPRVRENSVLAFFTAALIADQKREILATLTPGVGTSTGGGSVDGSVLRTVNLTSIVVGGGTKRTSPWEDVHLKRT